MRTTAEAPQHCPECNSHIHIVCNFREQSSAINIKRVGFVVGFVVLFIVAGLVPGIAAVGYFVGLLAGAIVAGVFYAWGNKFPKIRDLGCSKCKWKESFFVARKFTRLPKN